ncbi:MAG: hypothetical protein Salg2KO_17780 [Salibacteraceae bacterium]
MSRLTYISIFSLILLAAGMEGCYYDNAEDLYPEPEVPVNPTDTTDTTVVVDEVSFADDIQPFIQASCATSSGCHASGTSLPVLETYNQITNNIQRIEVRAIDEKSMPPGGGVNQQQLDDLKEWIDAGTPNN